MARLIPKLIVADIHLYAAVVDIDDVRADVVEEVTVVADNENRSEIVAEEIFKPSHRLDVKTVRRLVEQNYLGVAEKSLRKQNFDLFAFFQT